VQLLHRLCVSRYNIKRVHHDVVDVRHNRLRRGQGVRRRLRAASVMYLQFGLRIDGDDNGRLRG
jgi:hypothetical protein